MSLPAGMPNSSPDRLRCGPGARHVEYYLEEAHAPGTGAPEGDDAEKDAGAAKDIFPAVSIETKDEYPISHAKRQSVTDRPKR